MAVSTGAAILGAGALSAGSSLASGLMGSDSSKSAAQAQENAAVVNAIRAQQITDNLSPEIYNSYGMGRNWLQSGINTTYDGLNSANAALQSGKDAWNNALTNGTNYLNNGLGSWDTALANVTSLNNPGVQTYNAGNSLVQQLLSNPSSIISTPGYQFNLSEGTRALDQSAAAKGMLYSGSQGRALQQYGQNYATNSLNQWMGYGNQAIASGQPSVNNVTNANISTAQGKSALDQALAGLNTSYASGISGIGNSQASAALTSASNLSNSATSMANNYTGQSNALTNLYQGLLGSQNSSTTSYGNAAATGDMNSSNALSQGLTGVGNAATSALGNYSTYNMMNSLLGNQNAGSYNTASNWLQNSSPSFTPASASSLYSSSGLWK